MEILCFHRVHKDTKRDLGLSFGTTDSQLIYLVLVLFCLQLLVHIHFNGRLVFV